MDDAAIYKEVAESALRAGISINLGDIVVWKFNDQYSARAIDTAVPLAVRSDSLECIRAARAKLAAERDAKDAPKLREENERMRKALEEIRDMHKLPLMHCPGHRVAVEALKGTP